jgi:hypothetical protein
LIGNVLAADEIADLIAVGQVLRACDRLVRAYHPCVHAKGQQYHARNQQAADQSIERFHAKLLIQNDKN